MPITVNAAWNLKTGKTTVEYDGETANIVYLPNLITPKLVKRVQANSGDIEVLCKALVRIVHSWDVMGTPQQPDLDDDAEDDEVERVFGDQADEWDDEGNAPTNSNGTYPLQVGALMVLPLPFLSAVTEAVFSTAVPNSRKTGGK
jgi:hypothetical protein